MIKCSDKEHTVNTLLNGKMWKAFFLRSEKQTKMPLQPLFNNALDILGRTLRHEEENKDIEPEGKK